MQKLSVFLVFGLIVGTSSFLFPGTGGAGCSCQPACPPACPPPTSCGSGCRAKAKGSKNTGSVGNVDDLELRAQLVGFNLDDPENAADASSSQLKYLEKLGEEQQSDSHPEVVAAIRRAKESKTSRFAPRPQDSVKVSDSTAAPEIAPTKTSSEVTSAEKTGDSAASASKCNSDVLKQLMLDNITENSAESKHAINTLAEKKFAGPVDVICSRGHFSYVYSSNLYCEASKGEVTCIAFRQSV